MKDRGAFDKYQHILKEDGTYIEPKNFLDQFHIHMHMNREKALQGLTQEEIVQYEKCVDHYKKEHGGSFRQSSLFA